MTPAYCLLLLRSEIDILETNFLTIFRWRYLPHQTHFCSDFPDLLPTLSLTDEYHSQSHYAQYKHDMFTLQGAEEEQIDGIFIMKYCRCVNLLGPLLFSYILALT